MEMQGWINSGIIPLEVCEAERKAKEKIAELSARIRKGEQVMADEFPSIQDIKALTDFITKNSAQLYGEGILCKIYSRLGDEDPDIVWLSFVREAFTSIATKDPSAIHFSVARKILNDRYLITDPGAVDLLARELVEKCSTILSFKTFQHPAFSKNPIDLVDLDDHLKDGKSEMLMIDAEFIELLKKIGPKGRLLAKDVEKNCNDLFKAYEETGYSFLNRRGNWGLWLPDENGIVPVMTLLCLSLWEDTIRAKWEWTDRNVPALTKGVLVKTIKPLLSKDMAIIEQESGISCYANGKVVAIVACIDPRLLVQVRRGLGIFSSLNSHKLLRWEIRTAFENLANEIRDFRIIKTVGGYEKIANLIGCGRSKQSATEIKALLHAQAFCDFPFPDGSKSNLITLGKGKTLNNGEPTEIIISVGPSLLPHYTHLLPVGEQRRLIPITSLPPLIGARNMHAAQATLQMLVLEEFSNKSDVLASEKCVHIPSEKWDEMAREARLPLSSLSKVIQGWTEDDLFTKAFLQRQGEEYTLGESYEKELFFLEDQGKRRLDGAKGGMKSAEAKKSFSQGKNPKK